jgi:hypothetical protein
VGIPDPQLDVVADFSGDGEGYAETISDLDFFAAVAAGRPVKVWSGSAWVTRTLKVWSGSAWVTRPTKVWSGSAWV